MYIEVKTHWSDYLLHLSQYLNLWKQTIYKPFLYDSFIYKPVINPLDLPDNKILD